MIELAVCLPVLFAIVLGSIDSCNLIFLKQTLVAAAYEGAMVGSRPNVKEADIRERVNTVLTAQRITNATVQVEGKDADFDALTAGKRFTVTIKVKAGENMPGPIFLHIPGDTDASVVGHKTAVGVR